MEDFIGKHNETLGTFKAQGLSIPSNVIDYIYQQGYMPDIEYQKYYMDRTRKHIPKLQKTDNNNLSVELNSMCTRMETVERVRELVFAARQQSGVKFF